MDDENDDFLVTAPNEATLEVLAKPLINAWNITIKKLTPETPLETTVSTNPNYSEIYEEYSNDNMKTDNNSGLQKESLKISSDSMRKTDHTTTSPTCVESSGFY